MFKIKKMLSCIFASALIFSLSSVSAFAADNSLEKENLQTAITEGKTAPVASSPVLNEEKAKEIIDKLNETAVSNEYNYELSNIIETNKNLQNMIYKLS